MYFVTSTTALFGGERNEILIWVKSRMLVPEKINNGLSEGWNDWERFFDRAGLCFGWKHWPLESKYNLVTDIEAISFLKKRISSLFWKTLVRQQLQELNVTIIYYPKSRRAPTTFGYVTVSSRANVRLVLVRPVVVSVCCELFSITNRQLSCPLYVVCYTIVAIRSCAYMWILLRIKVLIFVLVYLYICTSSTVHYLWYNM